MKNFAGFPAPLTPKCLVSALVAAAFAPSVLASISVEFQFGAIDVPDGSLGVLVADTGGNGFQSPASLVGATLSRGSVLGTDDVIVETILDRDLPEWNALQGFAQHTAVIDYEELGVQEGQPLILYIFPERGENDPIRTGEPHVSYRTEGLTSLTANSTMGFALPADGGAYLLAVLDPTAGGTANLASVDLSPAPIVNNRGDFAGSLGEGARQTYYFEMSQAGFISINGVGAPGVQAALYHRDGRLVAQSAGNPPFWFENNLEAGWHTLVLYRTDGGSANLAYNLSFESEWVRTVQPDLALGRNWSMLMGGGTPFAPGAQLSLTSRKLKRVVAFTSIANMGDRPESISAQGRKGTKYFKLRYLGAEGNITAAITSGTFRSPLLHEGTAPVGFRSVVLPNKRNLRKKVRDREVILKKTHTNLLVARSTSNPALYDGGIVRVRAR